MIIKNRQNTQQNITTNSLNLRLSTLSLGKRSAIPQEDNSSTSKFHIINANDDLDSVITHKKKNAMTIDDWQEEDENDLQDKMKKAKQIANSHE